ncbi:MAG: zinc-binding dehydrogenase [Ktedonobacteraceae bacterium]
MWTSTLQLDLAHVMPTKILGTFWRGAYFSSFSPLQVQNLPRQPLPASNWVRVRNSLAGICGSDLHLIFVEGDFGIAPAALPSHSRTYPGHEVVGEVIEVGEDVQSLHVGDHVVLQHGPNCLTAGIQPLCRSCASGNYGLCESGTLPGPQSIGGGWSEEMLLHERQLFRVPPDISDAQAVLLEPSAVAVHAVLRHLPRAGDRVLIIGAGTIGQLILQVIRALAPDAEISVLARHAFQIERAASMGARIIYAQDSYEGVQDATGGQLYKGRFGNKMLLGGYDVIFDTVGSKRTTHDSLRWARAGSTVVMVGLSLHRMHIDLTPIWYQEVNLIGTLGHGIETWPVGTSEKKSTFEITAELIESGQIHPDKLITHSFLLTEYRDALLIARNKGRHRAMKVVFDFSKQPPSVVPNVRAAARQRQRVLTTSWPSQPLSPDDVATIPHPSTPDPEVPVTYATPDYTAANDDPRTIVVSRSKHARFNVASPQESPPSPLSPPDSTSKQAHFDIATQYGSLPGFHQGLEELGITDRQIEDTEGEEEDTNKSAAATLAQQAQHTEPEPTLITNTDADKDYVEAPFIAPTSTSDYAWMQFIEPQDTGENIVEPQSDTSTTTISANAEAPFVAPAPSTNIDEANTEDQLTAPANTPADNDDPKTITTSSSKRPRSRRKTGGQFNQP